MKQKLSLGVPEEADAKIRMLENQLAESTEQVERLQRWIDQKEQEPSGQESHSLQDAQ